MFFSPWAALILACLGGTGFALWPHPPISPEVLGPGPYRVIKVGPNGLLELENGASVAFLGIAPTRLSRNGVQNRAANQFVRLAFDRVLKSPAGNFLAYVYLDDVCLNEVLLRAGEARVDRDFPFQPQQKRIYLNLEEESRREGRGIWERQ